MPYNVIDCEGTVSKRPDSLDILRVLSLGAGVESTTVALMAAHGCLTTGLDAAVFADTGAEMAHTYQTLEWLIPELEEHGVAVHLVTAGDWPTLTEENVGIWADTLEIARGDATRGDHQPFFTEGKGGRSYSMTTRKCTRHYKIRPVSRKVREIMQSTGYNQVERWQGVSSQEMDRINAPNTQYTAHRFPLVDQRMSRSDCRVWLDRHGYPEVKKSACKQCPFRKKMGFSAMRREYPDTFNEVAQWEQQIRDAGGLPGMNGMPYLISDLRPLSEIKPLGENQKEMFESAIDMGGCSAGSCGL